jgi:hypothetical protein
VVIIPEVLWRHLLVLMCGHQVDFLVRQLEQQQEAAQQHLTPLVRNRRLAQLNRLIERGELSAAAAHHLTVKPAR